MKRIRALLNCRVLFFDIQKCFWRLIQILIKKIHGRELFFKICTIEYKDKWLWWNSKGLVCRESVGKPGPNETRHGNLITLQDKQQLWPNTFIISPPPVPKSTTTPDNTYKICGGQRGWRWRLEAAFLELRWTASQVVCEGQSCGFLAVIFEWCPLARVRGSSPVLLCLWWQPTEWWWLERE